MNEIIMTASQREVFQKYLGTGTVDRLRNIGRSIWFEIHDCFGDLEGFVVVGPNGKTEEEKI